MKLTPQVSAGMAEYIGLTDELISGLRNKVASLETNLKHEKTQKVASNQAPSLDVDAVNSTVSNIISAGFLKKADQEQAITAINSNPATLLDFLDKLASKTINNRQVKPTGKAVQQEKTASSTRRDSDVAFEQTFSRLGSQL